MATERAEIRMEQLDTKSALAIRTLAIVLATTAPAPTASRRPQLRSGRRPTPRNYTGATNDVIFPR